MPAASKAALRGAELERRFMPAELTARRARRPQELEQLD